MHYGNILVLYLRDYIMLLGILIIEMLKCSDVLWYRTLYRPISTLKMIINDQEYIGTKLKLVRQNLGIADT